MRSASNPHINKNEKGERWRPNGHKPDRLRYLYDNKTVVNSNNNVEDELDEEEVKMLKEKVETWLAGLDTDASGSFMRREIATAHTETN